MSLPSSSTSFKYPPCKMWPRMLLVVCSLLSIQTLELRKATDIIGVVKEVGDLTTITSKATSKVVSVSNMYSVRDPSLIREIW